MNPLVISFRSPRNNTWFVACANTCLAHGSSSLNFVAISMPRGKRCLSQACLGITPSLADLQNVSLVYIPVELDPKQPGVILNITGKHPRIGQ